MTRILGLKIGTDGSAPTAGFGQFYSDITNKATTNSYTTSALAIGTAHANRVVIVFIDSSQALDTPTLGGVTMTVGQSSTITKIFYLATGGTAIANDTTAVLVIANNSGSTAGHLGAATFYCYPSSPTPLEQPAVALASSTTDAVISDLDIVNGGFVAMFGRNGTNGDTLTFSWTGSDSVVADFNSNVENIVHNAGAHILCTQTITTLDLTMSSAVSGSKRLAAISFGAPA